MDEDFSMFSRRKDMESSDYYLSDDGYIVFTEKYHLNRGYCCKNGCKHCPYGFNKDKPNLKKKD
mgnify:CR=1 FL=1|tara:strand:- start:266 stop:457 length:192 start_codon:yes stop_codon:yes gene_type:complete